MKKAIATLLAVVMIATVVNVAVAVATSTPHVKALSPTSLMVTYYPKQVTRGKDFDVTGRLTSGGTGLGNKLVYHAYFDTTDNKWYWDWNFTTSADGSFTETFGINNPGPLTVRYEFWGDGQYAASTSDPITITAT